MHHHGAPPTFARIREKDPADGLCNICLEARSLTIDHVPPQSCLVERLLRIEPFEKLQNPPPRAARSQSGIRYRTLCERCNGELLGAVYDRHLARFVADIRRCLESRLYLPPLRVDCVPGAVARAVFGHLLAASTFTNRSTMDEAMRACVLDQTAAIPPTLRLFYWIHPHRTVTILRDVAMPARRGSFHRVSVFNILKFYPVGFLLTDLSAYEGLHCLNDYVEAPGKQSAAPLTTLMKRGVHWPEAVDEGNFLMGGQSLGRSIRARPA